eukprot:UN3947
MRHLIGSTHACHHVFSSLPCYNAVEATRHLKAFLEPRGLYNYHPTPWPVAACRASKTCLYVDDLRGTHYYQDLRGQAEGAVAEKNQDLRCQSERAILGRKLAVSSSFFVRR